MADYYNSAWTTDRHVKDIQTNMTITDQLTLLDGAIDGVCQMNGVSVDDIPVDGSGYITSTKLIDFARFWLYVELLGDYWGSSDGEEDVYYDKLQHYEGQLAKAEGALTNANIMQNSPLANSDQITQVVVY